MKRGLIVVDHGSRVASANALLDRIAARLAEHGVYDIVAVAHMEIASPSIADAFSDCASRGATFITIVPVFLASGSHVSTDIPRLAREAAALHPNIHWTLSQPIGFDERLIEIILDRARASESCKE